MGYPPFGCDDFYTCRHEALTTYPYFAESEWIRWETKNLVQRCLHLRPAARPTIWELEQQILCFLGTL